jgi:acetoacetate decarboxylase
MGEFKAMPVSAPLYRYQWNQQLRYPGADLLLVMYGVDPQRVADLVPPPLRIPGTPKVICLVARYPESFVGPYHEAATLIEASYGDGAASVPGWFVASMYVDTDAALAAGREIFGFPKKLAEIELGEDGGQRVGRLRRHDIALMEIRVEPAQEVDELPGGDVIGVLNLKLVPSPDLRGVGSSEITISDIAMPGPGSIRMGPASIEFGESAEDPIHPLRPGDRASPMMGAAIESEFLLSPGRVIHKLA